jgi:hypothetical protein
MINIQTILANDSYETMIGKINQNTQQLVTLNGGPSGKGGGQGMPGLPGFQGKVGIPGDDGVPGSRIFFYLSTPADESLRPIGATHIPKEEDLAALIANGDYSIGDVFLTNYSPYAADIIDKFAYFNGKHSFYKIAESLSTPVGYYYSVYTVFNNTSTDTLWEQNNDILMNHVGVFNKTSIEPFVNPSLIDIDNDTRNRFLLNTYVSSISDTGNEIIAQLSLRDSNTSAGRPIMWWNKSHFKLGLDQKYPYNKESIIEDDLITLLTMPGGSYVWDETQNSGQYLNMWDEAACNTEEDLSALGGSSLKNLSEFNILKKTTPLLYLQPFTEDKNEDASYQNFGIFVKRINSTAFGDSTYKSVLIFASGKENDNDIYFKSKNIWSESNFISEVNKNNQELDNKRFYTPFLSKEVGEFNNFLVNTTQHVFYGFSEYGLSSYRQTGDDAIERTFDIDTGLEVKSTDMLPYFTPAIAGSINTWSSITNANHGGFRRDKYLISRIDEFGCFKYRYVEDGSPEDYQNDINYITETSRYTIYEQESGIDVIKLVGKLIDSNFCMFRVENPANASEDMMVNIYAAQNTVDAGRIGFKLKRKLLGDTDYRESLTIISDAEDPIGNMSNSIDSYGSLYITSHRDDTQEGYGNIYFGIDTPSEGRKLIAGISKFESSLDSSIKSFMWAGRFIQHDDDVPQPDDENVVLYIGGLEDGRVVDKGKLQIKDDTQGTDKVLTSDANGVASWKYQINSGRYLIWEVGTDPPENEGTWDLFTSTWTIPYDAKTIMIHGDLSNVTANILLPDTAPDGYEVDIFINDLQRDDILNPATFNILNPDADDILKLTELDFGMLQASNEYLLPDWQNSLFVKIKYISGNYVVLLRVMNSQSGNGTTQEIIYGKPENTVFIDEL